MKKNMVSVVMTVFNEQKYLSKAIDSILAQSYPFWELIIVNDGSTDRSDEIIRTYDDERIRYFAYKENKGNPYALNMGMKNALGEYIVPFAGDDVAYPNMLEVQVEYLNNNPNCIHVHGTMDYIDSEGVVFKRNVVNKYTSDIEIRAYMLFGNCVTGGSSMFRRKALVEYGVRYDLEALVSQDYLFWLDMLPFGEFSAINDTVFQYRCNYGSNSHKIMDENREWYNNFMRRIFIHAWRQRGFDMNKKDIHFIHDFLYQKKLLWRGNDIKQGIETFRKVQKQIKELNLKEKDLILQYYIKEWKTIYGIYLYNNRVTMMFKKLKRRCD